MKLRSMPLTLATLVVALASAVLQIAGPSTAVGTQLPAIAGFSGR